MRAHHRHVAGVIMRAVLLLVGLVVLLIDDDQAEFGVGQEQRRARADHHRRLAGRDRGTVAGARARRQFANAIPAGARRSARQSGRGTARSARFPASGSAICSPRCERFGDRLEIDFGLARAGDAVEQRDLKPPAASARSASAAVALGRREVRQGEGRIGRRRRPARGISSTVERALVDQPVDHAGADSRLPARLRICRAAARPTEPRAAAAAPASAAAAAGRPAARRASPLRPEMLAHPQRHAAAPAARRQRIIGDPVDEAAQFLAKRRHVELFARRPSAGCAAADRGWRSPPRPRRCTSRAPSGTPTTSPGCRSCPPARGRNRPGRAPPAPARRRRGSRMRAARGAVHRRLKGRNAAGGLYRRRSARPAAAPVASANG